MGVKIKNSVYFETKGLFENYAKLILKQRWDFSNFFFFCKVDNDNIQHFKKISFNLSFIQREVLVVIKEKLNLTNFVIHDVVVLCSLNIKSLLEFYRVYNNQLKIIYACTPAGTFFFSTVLRKIKQLNILASLLLIFKLGFFFNYFKLLSLKFQRVCFVSYLTKSKVYYKLRILKNDNL